MKRLVLIISAILALAAPAAFAMEHGGHGSHGAAAHEEVVNGVKATFTVQTMAEAMKAMGMEMPKGVKETHHISVAFKDAKTGKQLSTGEVMLKVQGPDKGEQTRKLMAMQGHFGTDVTLAKKGKYGIMSKFKLDDGKVRSAKFWYEVK